MIQTQTLALSDEERRELAAIAEAIARSGGDREAVVRLISRQDEILKRAPTRLYDPQVDA
jgi:hypothetical protein